MLRNSAITATGAVLLPTFLAGCHKDEAVPPPAPNLGGQLMQVDLAQAAANLTILPQLMIEIYELAKQYDDVVFSILNSTKTDTWTNFIVNVVIDVAAAIAAGLAVATATPAAMPAIAFLSAFLKEWGIGKDKPSNLLVEVFEEFELGRIEMQNAIEDKLSSLVDPSNNYSNLTAAWKGPIVLNGTTYTLGDLASTKFTLGDEYNKLHDAGFTSMKKAVWNLLIMKCCTLAVESTWYIYIYKDPNDTHYPYHSLVDYAQTVMYPQNKGNYLRGGLQEENLNPRWDYYVLRSWRLGIKGNTFPEEASQILFVDDTPGHIINPHGLFNRDYVFKQFHLTKPVEFNEYFELSAAPHGDLCNYGDCPDDFDFTGGMFPGLTH